jgi:hypothetical protein
MRIVTQRTFILLARDKYMNDEGGRFLKEPETFPKDWWPRIQANIDALNAMDLQTATAEEVNAVTARQFYHQPVDHGQTCDECRSCTFPVIGLGWDTEYGENKVHLCPACVQKAAELARSVSKQGGA